MERTRAPYTATPWIWSKFCKRDGTPIETVEDVAETIAGSARYSESAELYGVSLDDANQHPDGLATVVCYTGNGPNAHNNARVIAAMMTQGVALLRKMVDERDHGFVYSADRRDAMALLDFLDGRTSTPQAGDAVREAVG